MEPTTNFVIADVESPYNAPTADLFKRNILYARVACRWALSNGYFPYASHLFFTQPGLLDDDVQAERDLGIMAGKAIIRESASTSLFFLDLGESSGMAFGREDAKAQGRDIVEIRLFETPLPRDIGFQALLDKVIDAGLITDGYRRIGWD